MINERQRWYNESVHVASVGLCPRCTTALLLDRVLLLLLLLRGDDTANINEVANDFTVVAFDC